MRTITVKQTEPATQLTSPDDGPVTIVNADTVNTLLVGTENTIIPSNQNTFVPLSAGNSFTTDGEHTYYAISATASPITVYVMAGATNFFQPPNLAAIGGASVFSQATAPPTTSPPNSLWFKTDGSLWQLIGGVWVQQQFNANSIIEAGTIVSALIAAGQIYAGIVNGTTITGSTINGGVFNGTNWIADANGTRFYSGAPATNNLIGSVGSTQYTDAFNNIVLPGVSAYNPTGGGFALFVQMVNGGINIGVSTGADETTGWTTQVSGLGATSAGVLQYANAVDGNVYRAGISTVRMATNQPLTSTSPTLITSQQFTLVAGFVYRIWFMANISSDTANAGGVQFSFGGTTVIGNVNGRFIAWQTGANTPSMGIIDGSLVTFNSFSPSVANTKQTIEVEMWATVNTTGLLKFNAALTNAAATFHVKSCIGRMEAVQ